MDYDGLFFEFVRLVVDSDMGFCFAKGVAFATGNWGSFSCAMDMGVERGAGGSRLVDIKLFAHTCMLLFGSVLKTTAGDGQLPG